jgi:mono/diheme cytochrome c family protein
VISQRKSGATRVAPVLLLLVALGAAAQDKPYTVAEGYKVDAKTMNGFRAWRAAACDRCHGASQQGLVGPSLLESMKTIDKATFAKTVTDGRLEKGMPSFSTSPTVMQNIDGLYAYLKGRANGDITRVKVEEK